MSVDAGSLKEWAGRTLKLFKSKVKFWIPSGKPLCTSTGWGLIGQEEALPVRARSFNSLPWQYRKPTFLSTFLTGSCSEVWAGLFSQVEQVTGWEEMALSCVREA